MYLLSLKMNRIVKRSSANRLRNTPTQVHGRDCGCREYVQKRELRNDTKLYVEGTGTGEYFIIRPRTAVITFLWFLFPLLLSSPPRRSTRTRLSSLFVERSANIHRHVHALLTIPDVIGLETTFTGRSEPPRAISDGNYRQTWRVSLRRAWMETEIS